MTREELIAHLEHLAEYVKYSEDAPALREVIEMLKCSEIPNSSEERTQKRTEIHGNVRVRFDRARNRETNYRQSKKQGADVEDARSYTTRTARGKDTNVLSRLH